MKNLFKDLAANENNPNWKNMIKRENILYARENDKRSEFERDYTRIIYTNAFKRLKHKTQVFFSPESDHICTRSEHVMYVESISYTLARYFGLNVELTRAIATAHDIGHSPFGHQGEYILSKISKQDIGQTFWHEKNGLDYVEKIELLEDDLRNKQNLNLTYAVRDGIISHCGEIDENSWKPRESFIDLQDYTKPNEYAPYTWEGCAVKIADKISYLGRDIEDAISLGIIDEHLDELYEILELPKNEVINNTVIINTILNDLCNNSNLENGFCFSEKIFNMTNKIKKFNYERIYLSERLKPSIRYFELVLNEIYNTLKKLYAGNTIENIKDMKKVYPKLIINFEEWLENYWNLERKNNAKNKVLFDMNNEKDFYKAIIYFISGMTDNFAIEMYNEIIGF